MKNISAAGGADIHLCSLFLKENFREPKFTQRCWWRRPSPGIWPHVDFCMSINFSEGSPSKVSTFVLGLPERSRLLPLSKCWYLDNSLQGGMSRKRMSSQDINVEISSLRSPSVFYHIYTRYKCFVQYRSKRSRVLQTASSVDTAVGEWRWLLTLSSA
jgi:hypothetical protein